jgi:hypothetical protein
MQLRGPGQAPLCLSLSYFSLSVIYFKNEESGNTALLPFVIIRFDDVATHSFAIFVSHTVLKI